MIGMDEGRGVNRLTFRKGAESGMDHVERAEGMPVGVTVDIRRVHELLPYTATVSVRRDFDDLSDARMWAERMVDLLWLAEAEE
ncbi:hypothetical protein [Bifidobacterium sp. SO1]|uniref:hypothetical protein n=1 Tax=Bifidobacterium sp. SO1 TaxID=2809029 RepID=UPI001BDC9BAB|nr:hypothetical protein [Bifidobacterium sp. SO1]MBT1162810.1 hypothetical protein [Bifidobacterium sp. SO1]